MSLLAIGFLALASAAAIPNADASPVTTENFTSPISPGYQLQSLNPASLGVDDVKQESGYLHTPAGAQLFYWLFESRDSPSDDPFIVWLNGGPGCSSLEAILFENGPSNIDKNNKLNRNPWSWNNHANVLYLDNPSGVGYSTGGHAVFDTVTASDDFKNAMKLFFEKHPQYSKNGFHIAGESYAGRYIPVFAEAINTSPDTKVNVSSILIGNGLVNAISQYDSYPPFLCGEGGHPAIFDEQKCKSLKDQIPACTNALKTCETGNWFQCNFANLWCAPLQFSFQFTRNPYDIRDSSCASSSSGLCYPLLDNVQEYFNDPHVRQTLGADNGWFVPKYQICNKAVSIGFRLLEDAFQPTYRNVTKLLDAGTPVLVYNGDADIILNWLGAREWTSDLEWSGQSGFRAAAESPVDWKPHGNVTRGQVTNYDKFTFLRVHDAGHMVPHDQPESASYMVDSWIKGDYKFSEKF